MFATSSRSLNGRAKLQQILIFVLCAVVLNLAECKSSVPATEILLVVGADDPVESKLQSLHVRVYDRGGKKLLKQRTLSLKTPSNDGSYSLPVSLSIVPPQQDSKDSVRIVVTGRGSTSADKPNQDLVEQQAIATFRPQKRQRLDVFLVGGCLELPCISADAPAAQTCDVHTGQCDDVPSFSELPPAKDDGVEQFELPGDAVHDASVVSVDSGGTMGVSGGSAETGGSNGSNGTGGSDGSGGSMATGGTSGGGCTDGCLDGETCMDGQCDCPGGRVTYYLDMDGDNHGDPYSPLEVCGDAPNGYVDSSDDCCDVDDLAYPGQDTPQSAPTQCDPYDFDFNCDGQIDGATAESYGTCCISWIDGWYGGIPLCGQYGVWQQCNTSTCYPETYSFLQVCL